MTATAGRAEAAERGDLRHAITLKSLLPVAPGPTADPRTVAPEVYESYLKGRFALHKATLPGTSGR